MFAFTLFKEGLARDLLELLVVSVLVGSLVAGAVAFTADTYFGKTVTGVLGNYGEYDIILHVRAERREEALKEIRKIVAREFPGARVKEGPTVVDRANFLVGLPDSLRRRETIERLPRVFGDIPGASGSTYIIEPRIVVSAVQGGAFQFLMARIQKLPGVRFAFRDGSSIGVVLKSVDDMKGTEAAIKDMLRSYQVVEVRLPMGEEIQDSVRAGAALAREFSSKSEFKYAEDITVRSRNDDIRDLTATLMEMRDFLQYYAARVTVIPEDVKGGNGDIRPGTVLVLRAVASDRNLGGGSGVDGSSSGAGIVNSNNNSNDSNGGRGVGAGGAAGVAGAAGIKGAASAGEVLMEVKEVVKATEIGKNSGEGKAGGKSGSKLGSKTDSKIDSKAGNGDKAKASADAGGNGDGHGHGNSGDAGYRINGIIVQGDISQLQAGQLEVGQPEVGKLQAEPREPQPRKSQAGAPPTALSQRPVSQPGKSSKSPISQVGGQVKAEAYLLGPQDSIGPRVGVATIVSERERLAYMVDESIRLMTELDKFSHDAYKTALDSLDVLGMYESTVGRLVQVQRTLEGINDGLLIHGNTLDQRDIARLAKALDDASGAMNSFASALDKVNFFEAQVDRVLGRTSDVRRIIDQEIQATSPESSPGLYQRLVAMKAALDLVEFKARERARAIDGFLAGLNPAAKNIASWQGRLKSIRSGLEDARALVNSGRAQAILGDLLDVTNSTLAQLQLLDVGSMRQKVGQVSKDLESLQNIDVSSMIGELKYIRESLPNLRDDQVGRSIRLIDRYIGGEVIPGDQLQVMVDGPPVTMSLARSAVRKVIKNDSFTVFITPVGILEPGIRGELFRVMREARATIAALMSVVFTLLVLILDHATLASALRYFARRGNASIRDGHRCEAFMSIGILGGIFDAGKAYGALTGAMILMLTYTFSGARLPYVSPVHILLAGALMGYIVSAQSDRISPVNGDEVTAAMALGLPYSEIIREIIIPAGRPGLLQLLNRRRMRLRPLARAGLRLQPGRGHGRVDARQPPAGA